MHIVNQKVIKSSSNKVGFRLIDINNNIITNNDNLASLSTYTNHILILGMRTFEEVTLKSDYLGLIVFRKRNLFTTYDDITRNENKLKIALVSDCDTSVKLIYYE